MEQKRTGYYRTGVNSIDRDSHEVVIKMWQQGGTVKLTVIRAGDDAVSDVTIRFEAEMLQWMMSLW